MCDVKYFAIAIAHHDYSTPDYHDMIIIMIYTLSSI